MMTPVQNILKFLELLSELEKREIALEILKRTVSFDRQTLTDEELALSAEKIFL